MKTTFTFLTIILLTLFVKQSNAQEYTFDDFVGTWNGTISSESFEGYNDPITMTIESDGFYTETSGHLMPTIYPNTQESDFDAATNRYHWRYLKTVYAGQSFYQDFYFEIVYFENDTLEMHYNFWDDPEPHPQAGIIFLVKQTTVGVEEDIIIKKKESELVRVIDMMGREIPNDTKGEILIFQYSDGTTKKNLIR